MKRIAFFLLVIISNSAYTQLNWKDYGLSKFNETRDSLTLVGLKNADGKVILEPKYNAIDNKVVGGYVKVTQLKGINLTDKNFIKYFAEHPLEIKTGLIDTTGLVLVEPFALNFSLPFIDNLTLVTIVDFNEDKFKYNLMTKQGKLLSEEYSPFVFNMDEKYFVVYSKGGLKSGLVNKKGEYILPFEYNDIQYKKLPQGEFVRVSKGKKHGIYSIDEKKFVVPIAFDFLEIPNERSYPFVNVRNEEKNGIYDISRNKFVVPCLFSEEISPQYYITTDNKKILKYFEIKNVETHAYGMIDVTGKVLLESIYTEIFPIQETEHYSAGYFKIVNNKGELTDGMKEKVLVGYFVFDYKSNSLQKSPLKFGYVAMGKTPNTALVSDYEAKGMGLINCITNKYIIEPILEFAEIIYGTNFFNAEKKDQMGVFDFSGKEIVPLGIYDTINFNFYRDTIPIFNVCKERKWGCIDSGGKIVVPVIFDNEIMYQNEMWAIKDGKWGCIDNTLKQIVDFKFDTAYYGNFEMNRYSKGFTCNVNQNQKLNFNTKGEYVIFREFKEVIVPDIKTAIKYKDTASIRYLFFVNKSEEKSTGFNHLLENYRIGDNFYPQAFKIIMNSDLNFMYVDNQGTYLHKITLTANKNGSDCSNEITKLSEKGINPNALCNGSTALIVYIKENSRIHLESVKALLKAGSKVSIKDSDAKDALYYAKKAPADVKKILKEYKAKEK